MITSIRAVSLLELIWKDERKRILDICSKTELPIKVIPFLGNLLFDDVHTTLLGQVRDIRVEDLLGVTQSNLTTQILKNSFQARSAW